ncbi:MAG: hypothetical protein ACI8QH_001364, partial [Flammeovirgaceae bacterium]
NSLFYQDLCFSSKTGRNLNQNLINHDPTGPANTFRLGATNYNWFLIVFLLITL